MYSGVIRPCSFATCFSFLTPNSWQADASEWPLLVSAKQRVRRSNSLARILSLPAVFAISISARLLSICLMRMRDLNLCSTCLPVLGSTVSHRMSENPFEYRPRASAQPMAKRDRSNGRLNPTIRVFALSTGHNTLSVKSRLEISLSRFSLPWSRAYCLRVVNPAESRLSRSSAWNRYSRRHTKVPSGFHVQSRALPKVSV